ncbi:TQXA domain-containing protein OS=Streptomyces fumanus OX=67302 GN=GCM10018772_04690 PE=4 SV=1 [Streptomyces fumanus]
MDGLKTYGGAVLHGDDGPEVPAGLFDMSVEGGGMLQTYCVDVLNPTQKDAKYQETPWSGTSLGTNKDAGRIRWILRNSYPQVDDLAALAKKAGVKDGRTAEDAAAGTQVAIWRYSDDADATAVDPAPSGSRTTWRRTPATGGRARRLPHPRPAAVSGRPGSRSARSRYTPTPAGPR